MATVNINGVAVNVAPGQVVSSDANGNISVTNQSVGSVAQQQPSLGRIVVEGAALGVGLGAGLSVGESIVDGIADLF